MDEDGDGRWEREIRLDAAGKPAESRLDRNGAGRPE
jgi:hypothetical protein